MSTGKVLLGLLAGVAAGAALGILFAPDKGSSTRRKISKNKDDLADMLEGKFDEFIDGVSKKFETVKEEAIHMAKKAKRKLEEKEAELLADAK